MKSLLAFLLSVIVSLETQAVSSFGELQTHAEVAAQFLCRQSFCLHRVPPLELKEVAGYLGYVDGKKSRISIAPRLNDGDTQLALIHEFSHVYRAQFNENEALWLDEGLSKFMEYSFSTVWPVSYMTRLQKTPSLSFIDYRPEGDGYMASFFLVLYLYNHFGQEKLLKKLMTSPRTGWESILSAIRELVAEGAVSIPLDHISKESILRHFAVAMWSNHKYAAKYGLFYVDERYQALTERSPEIPGPYPPSAERPMVIRYDRAFVDSGANEIYALVSEQPFQIKTAKAADKAIVFISLFY